MSQSNYGAISDNQSLNSEYTKKCDKRTSANSSMSENSGGNDFGYFEFSGKDGKTCPTCGGTGRIAKEQEESLVALIPYSDNRLRPRRTKLYVSISISVCLIVCGLIVFFLIPRAVVIRHDSVVNTTVNIDQKKESTQILFTDRLNISNYNYFDITVTDLDVLAYFDNIKVGSCEIKKEFIVPARTKSGMYQTNVTISATFDESNNLKYVIDLCTNPRRHVHDVLVQLQVTQTFAFMGHSEQATLSAYTYIDCSLPNSTFPM